MPLLMEEEQERQSRKQKHRRAGTTSVYHFVRYSLKSCTLALSKYLLNDLQQITVQEMFSECL